jgi:hypothetical protein
MIKLICAIAPALLLIIVNPAHDYVIDSINYMNSGESSKPGLGFQLFLKPVKNMPITIGTNHLPAWKTRLY